MRRISVMTAALLACGISLTSAFGAMAQSKMTFAELANYAGPDREKILIEGAKKEGKLSWYTSFVLQMADAMVTGFKQKYPFVEVDTYKANEGQVSGKIITEYKAGRHAVDVITVGPSGPAIIDAIGAQTWKSPYADQFPAGDMGRNADGTMVTIEADAKLLTYNTDLVKQAPKSWEDLLKPEWKNNLAFSDSPNVLPMIVGGLIEEWGKDKTVDYLNKLAKQNPAILSVNSAAIGEQVAAGDKFGTYGAQHNMELLKEKGAPVEGAPLGDTLFINTITTQLPPDPPHPYTALLFTDYLMTLDGGQKVLQSMHYPPTHPTLIGQNKLLAGRKQWVLTEERLDKGLPQWSALIKAAIK